MSLGPAPRPRQLAKLRMSVIIGTTVEWYDYMLYGAASATVFAPLFFPSHSEQAGLLLSFSTFAVGFAARPVGGLIFGHFGDRVGRKKMLMVSLTMMGLATMLIGALPTFHAIGLWAPLLLVVLRMVQGAGVGGEWGGAVLTAVEHAPPGRRGLYGSLPHMGLPIGLILSTLGFLAVSSLGDGAFLSWGWRIPFLISGLLIALGLWVRTSIEESPEFARAEKAGELPKLPLVDALRRFPKQILLVSGVVMGTGVYFYGVSTFSVSYAQTSGAFSRGQILAALLLGSAAMAIAVPLAGRWAERGRQRVVLLGSASLIPWVFVLFGAVKSGSMAALIPAFLVHGVLYATSYGALATYIAERFPAEVRFTASTLTYQAGSLLGGALAPLIATALVGWTGTIWIVCAYSAVFSVLGTISTWALGPDPARAPAAPALQEEPLA
ncbi:MHS family MFS transporter [Amycolatopsis acidicola]|uniref:Putative proline/betaine transporter n=1 Tax=Amycolatopsis acidicola TaxID=2596893 RepID=A0A5N0VI58_9PSEU|nr:MFS transporter [Amycolatopsis acidicola]KAA9164401.1 MHS family MFS transporter [Amycolatopsis acidicola]